VTWDPVLLGQYPPPVNVNIVQTNRGPVALGTFIEARAGWAAGEAARFQAWIIRSKEVGNKDQVLQMRKVNPIEALKYGTDLGYKVKLR